LLSERDRAALPLSTAVGNRLLRVVTKPLDGTEEPGI
jgi:hypothetical protein